MKKVNITKLCDGMVTAENVISPKGQLILEKNQRITSFDIAKFGFYNIQSVMVEDYLNMQSEPPQIRLTNVKHKYHISLHILEDNLNDIIARNVDPDEDKLIVDTVDIFEHLETSYELFSVMHELQKTDTSTMAHLMNVSLLCRLIGVWAGLDKEFVDHLTLAGLLHDIGKLRIPNEILLKPGKLTPEEFEEIKKHPLYSYEILKDMKVYKDIKYAALLHHEKFDGSGYPFGYTGDRIDDMTGIVTIADVYDAMTAKRCYHNAMCPFDVIADFEYDGINKYHPKYIGMFLNKIASTYIGSNVLLSNGREAKIIYVTDKYSRPTVSLTDDGSIIALKDNPDIKIVKVL